MGSHMNFKNFGDPSPQGESKPQGNFPLARQSSIYSLTFEELQNTWSGKDFGSMNMDELLKSIWTAEETQAMTSAAAAAAGGGGQGNFPGGNLQRQGSLTLPRTLSQKTVDEVWRDLVKDTGGGGGCGGGGSGCGGGGGGGGGSNMPQRQQTLNEMTLEEFLVRAGVVREDNNTQQIGVRPNNNGFYMANNMNTNNNSLAIGFQHQHHQQQQQQQPMRNNDMMVNHVIENKNPVQIQPQRPHQQQLQQQPLFPKQTTLAFGPSMNFLGSTQLTSPGARNSVVNVTNPSAHGGGMGVAGLGTGSPANQVSPDVVGKSSGDASPLSPLPYVFGRGRKSAALEKVVERRHRRMIKNRESAARSRARKQAYTLELEAEVAKLKELNQELQRKQAETMEMQKNQILETMKMRWGGKRQCLRRTLTGPW